MTTPAQAEEWIKLRFPIGTKVRLPDAVPKSHPNLSIPEKMAELFGSGRAFEVIGYYKLDSEPYWAVHLNTKTNKLNANFIFVTDWVIREEPRLEPVLLPKLEPVVQAKSPSEISWGAALTAPLATLLGLAAAKRGLKLLKKTPAAVVQNQLARAEVSKER